MIDSSKAPLSKVCVYCASSNQCDKVYRDAAFEVGSLLAQNNISIVYGGSSAGSMGALADGAIKHGGRITGILPEFLNTILLLLVGFIILLKRGDGWPLFYFRYGRIALFNVFKRRK